MNFMKRFQHYLTRRHQKNVNPHSDHAKSVWDNMEDMLNDIDTPAAIVKPNDNETISLTTVIFETEQSQYLVQIFSDGQAHLSQRAERHDTWSPGWWSIVNENKDFYE